MDVLECIRRRRSIRRFKPEKVGRSEIEQLIDCARWAPSWNNCKAVRYTAVENEAELKRIRRDAGGAGKRPHCGQCHLCCWCCPLSKSDPAMRGMGPRPRQRAPPGRCLIPASPARTSAWPPMPWAGHLYSGVL